MPNKIKTNSCHYLIYKLIKIEKHIILNFLKLWVQNLGIKIYSLIYYFGQFTFYFSILLLILVHLDLLFLKCKN